MSGTALYTSLIVMAFLAGAGTLATVLLFRQPHPGTRAREEAEAARPAPVAAAQPAPPRTAHHDYDTGEVYATGLADGFQARDAGRAWGEPRACGAAPGGVNAPADWRCVKPANHLYLHETATGGTWGDNTFEQAPVGPWQQHQAEPYPEGAPR